MRALLSFRNGDWHFWFIPKQLRQGIRRTVVLRLIIPRLERAKMVRAPRLAASAARRGARSFSNAEERASRSRPRAPRSRQCDGYLSRRPALLRSEWRP